MSEGAYESSYHHFLFEGTDIFVQFTDVFSHWILTLHRNYAKIVIETNGHKMHENVKYWGLTERVPVDLNHNHELMSLFATGLCMYSTC